MTRILHVSDLHFGPHYLPHVGEALIRFAQGLPYDLLVMSGDFTQRAKVSQYRDAAEFMARFPEGPTVVVPGNHDVPLYRAWERLMAPYREYQNHAYGELDYTLTTPFAEIVALNTSTPLRAVVNGVFRPQQLQLCHDAFEDREFDGLKIVVAHHPLVAPADYRGGKVAIGARRAAELFAHLQVDMVFGGHLHRAYTATTRDASEDCLHEFPTRLVYSGTTTSGRGRAGERGRNSLNVVDVDNQTITITKHYYLAEEEAFRPTCKLRFARGDQGLQLA